MLFPKTKSSTSSRISNLTAIPTITHTSIDACGRNAALWALKRGNSNLLAMKTLFTMYSNEQAKRSFESPLTSGRKEPAGKARAADGKDSWRAGGPHGD